MAKKKKLAKLVEAVSSILGDDPKKVKKLKKSKAMKRFVGKLEDRKRQFEKEVAAAKKDGKDASKRSGQIESLDTQIKRAKKILADM